MLKVDQVPGSASLRCLGAAEPLVPTVTPASTVAPTAVASFPPPPDDITKPSLKKAKHTSSTVPMVPIVAAIPTVAAMPGVVVLPAPTFNKDTRQGTRAVTAPAKLELEVDASKVSLSKVHKAKVGSVSTGESSVTGPKAASVKSFGTKPTSLKVKVPTEVAPDVPKFKAAVAEAASQVTSVSKVARIKTASPKAVTAGASQKTSMVVGPKNPGVPAAVAKSRALIAAPSAPGLVATGPKASTSPRAAVLEAPVVAMKPAASIMASAVLKPALLMQPEPNSIALKAQKIKAAAKLVPQLTESSVTAPKPVSPRASSIVAVSALHAATAAKSTVSKAKPSKPARAHADVATEVEVKLVQKAVVSKAAAVSKEAAPKQPTPKPPVLKVPKVELVPEAPAELKGMKKNLKRPLDAVEVAALPAPSSVSVQGLDSLEGSLIPWPAVLNDGAVHDFDMLSCALKPVDAAQLQLLIRDRTRYCSLDMAAWRMLPQAAKSRARKVTSRFSDWFAEERLEEQPDFLANYRPLSTPERVCLDFQLYSIMERIVGGAAQAEDGLPCPPELTTIISPPSLDEIGVDDGRITLPMSVSLIRERIQRQQYHSVCANCLDSFCCSSFFIMLRVMCLCRLTTCCWTLR